jgi:hypothetical protein
MLTDSSVFLLIAVLSLVLFDLVDYFGEEARALDITPERIEKYAQMRQALRMANSARRGAPPTLAIEPDRLVGPLTAILR